MARQLNKPCFRAGQHQEANHDSVAILDIQIIATKEIAVVLLPPLTIFATRRNLLITPHIGEAANVRIVTIRRVKAPRPVL